jgi:hypothetical protein
LLGILASGDIVEKEYLNGKRTSMVLGCRLRLLGILAPSETAETKSLIANRLFMMVELGVRLPAAYQGKSLCDLTSTNGTKYLIGSRAFVIVECRVRLLAACQSKLPCDCILPHQCPSCKYLLLRNRAHSGAADMVHLSLVPRLS